MSHAIDPSDHPPSDRRAELKLARRRSRAVRACSHRTCSRRPWAVVRHAAAGHPVEKPGDVRGRGRHRACRSSSPSPQSASATTSQVSLGYLSGPRRLAVLTVLFANFADAPGRGTRQSPGRCLAQDAAGDARFRSGDDATAMGTIEVRRASTGRCRGRQIQLSDVVGGGTVHSRRRRDHRRRRLGRRVGHHRRVGPRHPRGRRRSFRRHGRHARPFRSHRRAESRPGPANRFSTA